MDYKLKPTTVSGINPKTNKREVYSFEAGSDDFDNAEKKMKELESLGYKKIKRRFDTYISKFLQF